eukprot:TRINITY_DN1271_c1_g1_i1.p1 TRINITY_DN1271_c1_g1~~TRINITY_DN1271_c1_g1_i1.p1  ORF type:complete len:696 (-),score=193.35 TRINITY_DN1271_c1_g1_i1:77-2164(-)
MAATELTVIVKAPSGRCVAVRMAADATVGALRERAAAAVGDVPARRAVLSREEGGGAALDDGAATLRGVGLANEAVVVLSAAPRDPDFPVMVKLHNGRAFAVVINGDDDVRNLRTRVGEEEGIAPERVQLQVGSRELQDGSDCASAGLRQECCVKVTVLSAMAVLPEAEKERLLSSFVATKKIDILFCFDTTGSMYSVLQNVRDNVEEACTRLVTEVPDIRIGIMAVGDYCDAAMAYVTKQVDLTADAKKLARFARKVEATGGGDPPEAYEWGLRQATQMAWREDSSKALVMIGDYFPHPPSYTTEDIFWKDEVAKLSALGVKIYGVQAMSITNARPFYEELARLTGGVYLTFSNFALITDMFLAVCYREVNQQRLTEYVEEVKQGGRMDEAMISIMATLKQPNLEKKQADVEEMPAYPYDWWDRRNDHGHPLFKILAGQWVNVFATAPFHARKQKKRSNVKDSNSDSDSSGNSDEDRRARKRAVHHSHSDGAMAAAVAGTTERLRVGGGTVYTVCLLGSLGVGKTSVARQFTAREFAEEPVPDAEDCYEKQISVEGRSVTLKIVDMPSSLLLEAPSRTRRNLIGNGDGFAIVYDVTDRASFAAVEAFHKCATRAMEGDAHCNCVVVGNKVDLEDHAVPTDEGRRIAESLGTPFFEASAKTRENIDDLFVDLVQSIYLTKGIDGEPPDHRKCCVQ